MKWSARIIIAIAIFFLGFWLGQKTAQAPIVERKPAGAEEIKVGLALDFGLGQPKEFSNVSLPEKASVFALLEKVCRQENLPLEFKDFGGDLGVFVEAIGGVKNDPQKDVYWNYWVNGVYAQIGASNYHLNNNDRVIWKYSKNPYNK